MTSGISAPYPGLYDRLEITPRARDSVVKAAYRSIMQEIHPDKGGTDNELFNCVQEAYEVLSDKKRRSAYDRSHAPVEEGKLVGNYRILKKLAEGGFGTTYLGKHELAGEPVCFKHCHYLEPAYQDTLIKEAKAVWDLRHHSLPVMRDFQKMGDGSLALIMSYIPGPTWEQVVSKGGKMDPEDVAWITQRALNALKYLHFHGVVHGDVKPQNTIVQPESHTIVLVDFGLSMVKPTKDAKARGYTPVFASPEQLRGDPLVPESDLYSLGMTMLYALSGDIQAVERFDVPSSVPKELCDFIQRLIVRDVRGRPNWKEDLIETLRKLRLKVFGRDQSGLKPLRGFKS